MYVYPRTIVDIGPPADIPYSGRYVCSRTIVIIDVPVARKCTEYRIEFQGVLHQCDRNVDYRRKEFQKITFIKEARITCR